MAVQYTCGFKSLLHKADHFSAHGARLGVSAEEDYETLADNFLGPAISATTRQHKRSWNGDLVRYDEVVDVFAVLDCDGFIKTCYRPDPQVHGARTNLDYYLDEEGNA
jgi:pyocin large subunit-like protein